MPDTIRIQMVLDKVQVFLEQWLDGRLKRIYQKDFWQMAVLNALTAEQREEVEESGAKSLAELDLAMLIAVFLGNFRALRKSAHVDSELTDMAKHVKKIRNLYAHRNAKTIRKPDSQKVKYHIDTLKHFLEGLGADAPLLREVDQLYTAIASDSAKPLPIQRGVMRGGLNEIKISVSAGPIHQQGVSKIMEKSNMSVPSKTKLPPPAADSHYPFAQVEKWCQTVNFARQMYEAVFSQEAKIVDGKHRENSSAKGRGNWDYLIVMPFSGTADKALQSTKLMWNCPDSTPYCEAGHIVWEFPYCAELPKPKVEKFYSAGYVPPAFDDYIEACHGTEYRPDANRVNNNLHAVTHDTHWYLGTYFPRSFVESFCIYDYVLSHCLDEVRAGKDTLTICDVGIGSGGATYGLIWALRKRLHGDASFKKIKVYGFDGNAPALRLFEGMKGVMSDAWPIEYEFVTKQAYFSEGCILNREAVAEKADFVIASKCLQELVREKMELESVYKTFLADAQNVISDRGLISVVEISATERMSALNKAFSDMGRGRAILVPRASSGVGCVEEKCFEILSTRIANPIHESILFAVAGAEALLAKFPPWVSETCLAMSGVDADSEFEETTHERSRQ